MANEVPRRQSPASGNANKRFHGAYEGHEMRRTQEMQDAGMLKMDFGAVANLPQAVEYKPWAMNKSSPGFSDGKMDDTIDSINNQEQSDKSGMHKDLGIHKW